MRISVKMVDGSRIDVPVPEGQEFDDDSLKGGWIKAYEDNNKQIILRCSNIVSIIINKGDGNDS